MGLSVADFFAEELAAQGRSWSSMNQEDVDLWTEINGGGPWDPNYNPEFAPDRDYSQPYYGSGPTPHTARYQELVAKSEASGFRQAPRNSGLDLGGFLTAVIQSGIPWHENFLKDVDNIENSKGILQEVPGLTIIGIAAGAALGAGVAAGGAGAETGLAAGAATGAEASGVGFGLSEALGGMAAPEAVAAGAPFATASGGAAGAGTFGAAAEAAGASTGASTVVPEVTTVAPAVTAGTGGTMGGLEALSAAEPAAFGEAAGTAAAAGATPTPGLINGALDWMNKNQALTTAGVGLLSGVVQGVGSNITQNELLDKKTASEKELLAQKTTEEANTAEARRRFIQGGSYFGAPVPVRPGSSRILRRPDGTPVYAANGGLIATAMR